MIDSVYNVLDAYKRQGRINVVAAQRAIEYLPPRLVPDWSKAQRTAVTPEVEFSVDVLSKVNEHVGDWLAGRTGKVTWDTLDACIDEAVRSTQSYWTAHGCVPPKVEDIAYVVRRYLVSCIQQHRSGGKEADWKFKALVERVGGFNGYSVHDMEDTIMFAPYGFLTDYFQLPDEKSVEKMLRWYHLCRNGMRVRDNDPKTFYCEPFMLQDHFRVFALFPGNSEMTDKYDCWPYRLEKHLQEECPGVMEWYKDPTNILAAEDTRVVYCMHSVNTVYLMGPKGATVDDSLTFDLVWDAWLRSPEPSSAEAPSFCSGFNPVVKDGEWKTLTAVKDITREVYELIGYDGRGNAQDFHRVITERHRMLQS